MFLPDRYVKGICPCCKTPGQYGDNCEVCSSTYSPLDLIDPKSTITGATPVAKDSEHYFFQLSNYSVFLHNWITQGHHLAEEISNKLLEWFKEGLHDLDISRDAPYFGFKIPGTENKFFYVWIDAPIGYMAAFKNLCLHRKDLNFDEYWSPATNTELYHFIGKDIINFHAIFWPAILKSADFRTPTAVFAHGYVTVNGQKMSKSRGTYISARHYLNHLDPEYLRYYFASKLSHKTEDIDFNWHDFIQKINSDLIGKLVNIASRCASFINKKFANKLSATLLMPNLILEFISKGDEIAAYYENRDYNRAMKSIMELADQANQMIDAEKPWLLIKNSDSIRRAHEMNSKKKSISTKDLTALVNEIDALLPQTQCGQCSYSGCLPYAQAIAENKAEINRCPPGATLLMPNLILEFISKGDEIAAYYENRDYNRAMKSIMELADQANQMIDAEKPWLLIKNSDSIRRAHEMNSKKKSISTKDLTALVNEIDALLPQTQCGQCSYSGCLPYAQAIAENKAEINRCPPGGIKTLQSLAKLLEKKSEPFMEEMLKQITPPMIASIRESECIGCTKCIQACPVDAILGAAKQLHVVLTQECTGCRLCLSPCPVDCIDMLSLSQPNYNPEQARERYYAKNQRLELTQDQTSLIKNNTQPQDEQNAYIQAAIRRVKEKKQRLPSTLARVNNIKLYI
ncbi:hypothetical protein FQR65_LT14161 [Abscondita terminalis]|nr:hypothetical protein FQR65_LT14161 [Abscondita terminalis]